MQAIRAYLVLGVLLPVLNACIEPFTPNIGESEGYLVINGTVTDEEGYQFAEISRTSSYSDREYFPLNECEVKVIDGQGNIFIMENYDNGQYRTWMDKQYLQKGNRYMLQVICDGKTYESEYDSLLPCPDIDSIYYKEISIEPDDPTETSKTGLQFYIDYDATGDYAENYRWEAVETWEYNAEERIFLIYNGIKFDEHDSMYKLDIRILSIFNENDRKTMDSLYTCWITREVNSIYTYTSHQKIDKKVSGLPLYVVTNKSNRLTIKYSILIKQLTLSSTAFNYWNQLQTQSQENGGLYETQPYQLKGNIKCLDDEEENVIGLFSASSVRTKRFTTSIHMNRQNYYCADIVEGWNRLLTYLWGGEIGQPPPNEDLLPVSPLYLHPFFDEMNSLRPDTFSLINQSCIDCTLKGGTLTKPDYW